MVLMPTVSMPMVSMPMVKRCGPLSERKVGGDLLEVVEVVVDAWLKSLIPVTIEIGTIK